MNGQQRLKTLLQLFLLALFVLIIVVLQKHYLNLVAWVEHAGVLAPLAFIAVYILATILFLPTLALTLLSGGLFGLLPGILFSLIGATLGASIAFVLSRKWLGTYFSTARFETLMQKIDKRHWRTMAVVRMVPIMPFHWINYGLGLSTIPLRTFIIGTLVFLLPGEIVYTYAGMKGLHWFF